MKTKAFTLWASPNIFPSIFRQGKNYIIVDVWQTAAMVIEGFFTSTPTTLMKVNGETRAYTIKRHD